MSFDFGFSYHQTFLTYNIIYIYIYVYMYIYIFNARQSHSNNSYSAEQIQVINNDYNALQLMINLVSLDVSRFSSIIILIIQYLCNYISSAL